MNKQNQQRHALHRRQRLPPVNEDGLPISLSVGPPAVPLPSRVPGAGGPGRGRVDDEEEEEEEEEEDEDNGGTLSACSVTCLTAHLGEDCRTVSCMCNNPLIVSANTCMAVTCPTRDRRLFLTNIRNWCGRSLAASLAIPGGADTLTTALPVSASSIATSAASAASSSSLVSGSTALSPISGSTTLESTVIESSTVASTTSRAVVSRTTTRAASSTIEDDADLTTTTTGRVNPKIGGNALAADGTDVNAENASNGDGESKGLTTGSIAGIVIGMIIAFAIVGLCGWYVRKSLMGRTSKAKEFLRSSEPGDWINQDAASKGGMAGGGGTNEKLDDYDEGNERIENSMAQRTGSGLVNVQPGIGAYTRSLPAIPPQHGYTTSRSSSLPSPAGTAGGASEFGGMYPTAGTAILANTSPHHARNQHESMPQSVRQYDEIHNSLAYPSHMGIQPTSPYNVHPGHYSHMSMGSQQGYVHPFAQVRAHMQPQQQQLLEQQRMQMQQQQQQQMQMHYGTPAQSLHDQYITPRNSLHTPVASSFHSTGMDSNIANHSHHHHGSSGGGGVTDSPYPECIHGSPDTVNGMTGNDGSILISNAQQQGGSGSMNRHQSIPFIIPPSIPRQAAQHGHSGSMSGLPHSLTAGQGAGGLASSPMSRSSVSMANAAQGQDEQQQEQQQKRATQHLAQGVPLPMSPPPMLASLPVHTPMAMPMPGTMTSAPAQTEQAEEVGHGKEAVENPFLDGEVKDDKKDDGEARTSFEGLAYLTR